MTWDGAKWVPAGASGVVTSFNTRQGAITLNSSDVTSAGGAPINNPTFTGVVTIPAGASIAGYARSASPVFTGSPTAPTVTPPTDSSTLLATTAFVQSAATTAAAPAFNDVGRNLLHNPLFNVQQRGVGPWTGNGNYTADRWLQGFTAGTLSTTIGTINDTNRSQIGDENAAFHLVATVAGGAGASDESYIEQRVESVRRTAGKTVTLSFWAAATSGTPKLGIPLIQLFGTGGSPSAAVVVNGQTVTLSTTYTRYSLTYAIPSVAGKTFGTNGNDCLLVRFGLSAGASQPMYGGIGQQNFVLALWGVQLEIGSQMTPLDKPDPQVDLANCQRFYQVGRLYFSGYGTAGIGIAVSMTLPVEMRANPTTGVTTNNSNNTINQTLAALSPRAVFTYPTTVNATGAWLQDVSFSASADL